MPLITAFVGHSFLEADRDVVRVFLDYLNTIPEAELSWEHAEAAEIEQLSAKVLALTRDKDLFIGVCTKKERVIAPDQLHAGWFIPGSLQGRTEHFEWKTSDWITQEIGLAVGLGLKLMLLVEEGVRRPGGLQGDIEYIPFTRTAPERAFPKINQMLSVRPVTL